ncbi:DUF116 domain-containing protein [Candidatus Woesearchaeota archaeon]|nr:DUF116 domain-containing protein [Candidatus Woesearchaeota archaeon]
MKSIYRDKEVHNMQETATADNELGEMLAEVPYSERALLLPYCLTSNFCQGKRQEHGITACQACYSPLERELREEDGRKRPGTLCKIPVMTEVAHDIGYEDIKIFTGGSGILPYFEEHGLPKAVLAIACAQEIEQGLEMTAHMGIPTQVAYLAREGCAETELFHDPANYLKEWIQILTRHPPQLGQ